MTVAARERIRTEVFATDKEAVRVVARIIAAEIRKANADGRPAVLGLATGSTPVGVYRRLIWMHNPKALRSDFETAEEDQEFGRLSFRNVYTFNLDEYYPMAPETTQSYHRWMEENFFQYIDLPRDHRFIPDGTVPRARLDEYCHWYEEQIRKLGGLDLQILGIGRTGHIGFNEPGSPPDSRTRPAQLDPITRKDAAGDFFGEQFVPRQALTMGVGTIMSARRVVLMAFGEHKAPIVRRMVEEPPTSDVPAGYLQDHPNATVYVDRAAARDLTRIRTPWLVRPMDWTDEEEKSAVIRLSRDRKKAILKLNSSDYTDNHLHDLLNKRGPVDALNQRVFLNLLSKISENPGGEGAKRVLVFSPHPDDDVISMGGTIIRLARHGHRVHVAYQTSGNIAVFDHAVRRLLDFVSEVNRGFQIDVERTGALRERVVQFFENKKPGEVDTPEVQSLKALIRRTEATAGAMHCGVAEGDLHFLEMPFYRTGRVGKKPLSQADLDAVAAVIERVKPDQVYLAGEHSDPHGTHRMCAEAIYHVLRRMPGWEKTMQVWLYRGAWEEWEPDEVDMLVPVSPEELSRKRFAIFRHESQKDTAMFPGRDAREFWQRAEDRNKHTAAQFDQLGLPEFFAMEGFVRLTPEMLRM
jgi:glucosamine-6-phosphate deaminase